MSEIDVSKCIHYHDGGCGNDNTMFECCSKNNCMYKQLQQLKQENDELRKIQIGHCQGENLYNLYQYKQCLEEIDEMCKHDCEYECSNDNTKCGICSCLEQRIQRKIKQAKEGK